MLLRLIGFLMPLRSTEREEALGMDVIHYGEEAYATGEGAILVSPESGVEAEVPRQAVDATSRRPLAARAPRRA